MEEKTRDNRAHLLRQIDLEHEAAQLALTGFAITSKHDFITQRMELIADAVQTTRKQSSDEQAFTLLCNALDSLYTEVTALGADTALPTSTSFSSAQQLSSLYQEG